MAFCNWLAFVTVFGLLSVSNAHALVLFGKAAALAVLHAPDSNVAKCTTCVMPFSRIMRAMLSCSIGMQTHGISMPCHKGHESRQAQPSQHLPSTRRSTGLV